MSTIDYLSLGILVLLWGAQLKKRPFLVRHARSAFFLTCGILILIFIWQAHEQFITISQSGEPGKYFIPPYTPLSEFLFSMWSRFFSRYLLALGGAVLFLVLVHLIPKRFTEIWFEPEEPYLIAIVLTLTGHPQWVLYGAITILCFLGYAAVQAVRKGGNARASFYPLWIPAGIIFIFANPFLKQLPLLAAFTTGA